MKISFHGADRYRLLAWQQATGRPERTFLVHGEEEALQAFTGQLQRTEVNPPRLHEEFAP